MKVKTTVNFIQNCFLKNYLGGKASNKSSFANYNESDDSDGSERKKAIARKEEKSLIEKQFALRKCQAALAMEMVKSTQISRCKYATNTSAKITGLTVSS